MSPAAIAAHCPSCGSAGLETVYEVRGVPTHSCLLMSTSEQAAGYPLGDVVLGFCGACGFATNTAFDVARNAYSPVYEEVQTFSATFNKFQSALVERLVAKRGMRGVDVVEIGCGKGEFLMELCERGGSRGVGIDPSWLPGRGRFGASDRVRFLPELYSAERHGSLPVDLLVCRHTLEHIHPTREFLTAVRRSLDDASPPLVFFEVPDQERVYDECAFWDIYYEHTSYFTSGSLARLFLSCGFEVLDVWKDFGDQYLMIEARPLPPGQTPAYRVSEDPAELAARVRDFAERAPRVLADWRERFAGWAREGRRAVVWGAGSKCVAFLTSLGVRDEVAYAVDINPHKQGCFLPGTGHEVVGPDYLPGQPPDVVVLMNAIYRDEVARQLGEMGLHPELVPV